jgi:hypothetical protein
MNYKENEQIKNLIKNIILFSLLICYFSGCMEAVSYNIDKEQLLEQPEVKINFVTLKNDKNYFFGNEGGFLMLKMKDSVKYYAVIGIDDQFNRVEINLDDIKQVEIEKQENNMTKTFLFLLVLFPCICLIALLTGLNLQGIHQ